MAEKEITGSIPSGLITKDTEMVFVAGQAFINASKHEEVVDHHVRAAERLAEAGDRMATLIEQRWSGPKWCCTCPVCSSAQAWRDFRGQYG